MTRKFNATDAACGALFLFLGVAICIYTDLKLSIGSISRMGPGFFPMLIGILIAFVGALIAWGARGEDTVPVGPISWRGMIAIPLAPIVFGLAIEPLGLIAAVALTTLVATLAARSTVKRTVAVVVGLTIFCVATFYYLGLPATLIGPWLSWS